MSAIIAVLVTRGSATISVLFAIRFQALAEDRMVVGDVGADQQDHVGFRQVFVGAGRAVAAEGALVAGDGAGHAERGVAVVVAGAEAELHQLAERVELFGDQLAGADDAERVRAVLRLVARNVSTIMSRLRPSRRAPACRSCAAADTCARFGASSVWCSESPLGQSLPQIDGVIRDCRGR